MNRAEVMAAIGSIIGRMAAPDSELSTHRWLQRESGLSDLLDYDFNQCSLTRLYRACDQIKRKVFGKRFKATMLCGDTPSTEYS